MTSKNTHTVLLIYLPQENKPKLVFTKIKKYDVKIILITTK